MSPEHYFLSPELYFYGFQGLFFSFPVVSFLVYPWDIEILGWSPAGLVLPHGEKLSL